MCRISLPLVTKGADYRLCGRLQHVEYSDDIVSYFFSCSYIILIMDLRHYDYFELLSFKINNNHIFDKKK